jgi:hypothetical protein
VHWDGFDVSVDARLQNGVYLQGGVSTGKTTNDVCDIVDDVPESLQIPAAIPAGIQALVAPLSAWVPNAYCHMETPLQPQWKALASYNLPYGVRVAGTWQSLPGPQIAANTIYNNAATGAGLTTLGRNFTLAQATGERHCAGQRLWRSAEPVRPAIHEGRLDRLRTRRPQRRPLQRVQLGCDHPAAQHVGAAGLVTPSAWQLPLTVIQPRFVKFSARWDF